MSPGGVCKEGGYAKNCQENGGKTVDLAGHIRSLWHEINFSPSTFELPNQADTEDQTDVVKQRDEVDKLKC